MDERNAYEMELERQLTALRERTANQSREIAQLLRVVEDRNRSLDAMHWVWCDGGCEFGVHRFTEPRPEVTDVIVAAALRNTDRLRAWKVNHDVKRRDRSQRRATLQERKETKTMNLKTLITLIVGVAGLAVTTWKGPTAWGAVSSGVAALALFVGTLGIVPVKDAEYVADLEEALIADRGPDVAQRVALRSRLRLLARFGRLA